MSEQSTSKYQFGLLPRIIVAIILGIAFGLVLPDAVVRIFVTFNHVFGQLLNFVIPLIIVGLIAPAIADLGRGAGKWLAVTAGIAYGSTLSAGLIAFGASMLVLPRVLDGRAAESLTNPEEALLAPFFELQITPLFGVMSALVLAFIVGIGITAVPGDVMRRGFDEFREIIGLVISKMIIPLLPIYIFGIFLNMTRAGQVFTVITTFLGVIVFVFILTVVVLLLQFAVAGAVAGKSPLRMLATMLPAYMTALGTSSSAATIPVTLRQTIKLGVTPAVASFTVPLCATIHLAGSTLKITSFSIAVMLLFGIPIDPATMIGFVLMLGIMMVAAPGVPGGAIMTAAGLLTSMLGFTDPQVGLMIATYIAIDSFGTATNVTGDGAIATVVDRLISRRNRKDVAQTQAAEVAA